VAKAPEAFRTISEVSEILGVPSHVLRAWEARLPFVRPMRLAGGRRFYRPRDIAILQEVRRQVQDQGLSLDQVRRQRRSRPVEAMSSPSLEGGRLRALLNDLTEARERLRRALRRLL